MTRTARRRWTRDLESLVDGIAIGEAGPVLMHGYDDPAGGKWIEDVIPGKLAALDRNSGEVLWSSPCEVGYGRGFGAGLGAENDVVVLGPSAQGHRIVRMSLESGELLGASSVEAFDEALVFEDLCLCITPTRISAVLTSDMVEVWSFQRAGHRFHQMSRAGDDVFVVTENTKTKLQGVVALHAETGRPKRTMIEPRQKLIYASVAQAGSLIVLCSDLLEILPPDQWPEDDLPPSTLWLVGLPSAGKAGDAALWYEGVPVERGDEYPDVQIWADSGKLYLLREALVDVRDAQSGTRLGELTVPGLDERVAWGVRQGAGLLAEEQRVSIFEIPV